MPNGDEVGRGASDLLPSAFSPEGWLSLAVGWCVSVDAT